MYSNQKHSLHQFSKKIYFIRRNEGDLIKFNRNEILQYLLLSIVPSFPIQNNYEMFIQNRKFHIHQHPYRDHLYRQCNYNLYINIHSFSIRWQIVLLFFLRFYLRFLSNITVSVVAHSSKLVILKQSLVVTKIIIQMIFGCHKVKVSKPFRGNANKKMYLKSSAVDGRSISKRDFIHYEATVQMIKLTRQRYEYNC